ncbi:MAG: hypothetical protein ABI315_14445 [Bacteroidia bacterium]
MKIAEQTTTLQNIFKILLGIFMIAAGVGHLTFQRSEFQAQVPNWLPLGKDLVVILSGIIEIVLGISMIFWKKQKVKVGILLALFYVAVFPGNIAQYLNKTDAFGLNTNSARLIRLFFQPVLILLSLWSTGALKVIFNRRRVR